MCCQLYIRAPWFIFRWRSINDHFVSSVDSSTSYSSFWSLSDWLTGPGGEPQFSRPSEMRRESTHVHSTHVRCPVCPLFLVTFINRPPTDEPCRRFFWFCQCRPARPKTTTRRRSFSIDSYTTTFTPLPNRKWAIFPYYRILICYQHFKWTVLPVGKKMCLSIVHISDIFGQMWGTTGDGRVCRVREC